MLTQKQRELLRYIQDCLNRTGVTPSFDEMKDALNLKSKSGIHRLVLALEERGFIRRIQNRARALEIIKMPADETIQAKSGFTPSVVPGGLSEKPKQSMRLIEKPAERFTSIPVMGRIAAGTPISAIENPTHSIAVPPDFLSSGEHYALEVRGDSMVEAGILDGDLAVIRKQNSADTGDIVVALIDDEEATLKRFRRRGSSIALEAANPAYETRVLGPDRVSIQGRLVSLVRRY